MTSTETRIGSRYVKSVSFGNKNNAYQTPESDANTIGPILLSISCA